MPVFTPLQIKKLINLAHKNRIAPVYLFIGPEHICKEKAKEIYNVFKEKNVISETYDLREKDEKKEFLGIKGYQEGLFGIKKVFFVFGAEDISEKKGEEIVESCKKSSLFTWFFIAESFSENHPLYRFALEKGAIIPFYTRKNEDLLESELIGILKEHGKVMDKNTAQLFISLVGEDYHHFKNELEKLIFYTGDKKYITQEDIFSVVVPLESALLYLLGDYIFTETPEKCYRLLQNLFDHKVEPPLILGYLYRFFKKMQIFQEVLKKYPELEKEERYVNFSRKLEEIKGDPVSELPRTILETKAYPLFKMKKYLRQIKDFTPIFEKLHQTDIAIKRDFRNPEKAFYEFFLELWKILHQRQNN